MTNKLPGLWRFQHVAALCWLNEQPNTWICLQKEKKLPTLRIMQSYWINAVIICRMKMNVEKSLRQDCSVV